MRRFDENELEHFIRQNRDKFNDLHTPNENHEKTFLFKLNARIRHYVSILPHLIKVAIVTVVIFIASIIIWNNYIRKDRHEVTLKQKIVNVITGIVNK